MDERDSTLQKLLDLLFGDDVEVEVVAVLPDLGPLTPRQRRDTYHAILIGLEGEEVVEMEVQADQWRDGRPP